MSERTWDADARIERIRAMAGRFCKQAEGESVRECIDALALAAGVLINQVYRSPAAKSVAAQQAQQHIEAQIYVSLK